MYRSGYGRSLRWNGLCLDAQQSRDAEHGEYSDERPQHSGNWWENEIEEEGGDGERIDKRWTKGKRNWDSMCTMIREGGKRKWSRIKWWTFISVTKWGKMDEKATDYIIWMIRYLIPEHDGPADGTGRRRTQQHLPGGYCMMEVYHISVLP